MRTYREPGLVVVDATMGPTGSSGSGQLVSHPLERRGDLYGMVPEVPP